MNGYKAFYRGRSLDVRAETSRAAQLEAAKRFRARKSYEVSVILCERDGERVAHSTATL